MTDQDSEFPLRDGMVAEEAKGKRTIRELLCPDL